MADDFHVDIALGLSELASILAAARSAEHPLRLAPRKPLDAPLPPLLPPRTAAFYPEPAFDNFWTDGTWLAEGGRLSAYADAIISAAATIAKRDQAISHSTRHAIMVSLSELMLEPRLTMEIVRLFRPLVVDLVARWAAACVPGNTGLGDGSQIASDLSTLSLGSKTNSAVSLLGKRTRDQRSSDSGSAHAQMPTQPQISTDRLESILVALCRVLPNAPQVASVATAVLCSELGIFPLLAKISNILSEPSLSASINSARRLARSAFRLIWWSRGTPHLRGTRLAWSAELTQLLEFPDSITRRYVAWSISVANDFTELQRLELFRSINVDLADDDKAGISSEFLGTKLDIMDLDTEGSIGQDKGVWGLGVSDHALFAHDLSDSILVEERTHDYFDALFAGVMASTARFLNDREAAVEEPGICVISSLHLCSLVTDACGVLLVKQITNIEPLESVALAQSHALVLTSTTRANLQMAALAVSQHKPVLLEGPIGAGKTALVEELARLTGRHDVIKVHLGDQTDSKLLLGSYMTTAVPGEFRWQPGVLTQAVLAGRWILFEDVDRAPSDVMTALLPLLEGRKLFIAERGEEVAATQGFRIFGTVRTLGSDRNRPGSRIPASRSASLRGHAGSWTRVSVNEPTDEEVRQIVQERYPSLSVLWETMFRCYFDVIANRASADTSGRSTGREVTLRDLIKWCDRTSSALGASIVAEDPQKATSLSLGVRQRLLADAIDCFVGMVPNSGLRQELISQLADTLQAETHTSLAATAAPIGTFDQPGPLRPRKRPFALTRHASILLEKLKSGVQHTEPLLLVGETGAGKTSVVQYLADSRRRKLVVVNMSQQSDSSDLLGGFKPVDTRTLVAPLKEKFDDLFERTFPLKGNAAFLTSLRKVYNKRKWDKVFVGFRNACDMATKALDRGRPAKKGRHNEPVNDETGRAEASHQEDHTPEERANTFQLLKTEWADFSLKVETMQRLHEKMRSNVMFSFVEGLLVKAVKEGHWILLDEVNLASAETLESLSGLLQASHESLLLTEKGDVEPVQRNPDFRLFACMNPATDVGKRDLPPGLRSRFTEIYVDSPDRDRDDLLIVVSSYLKEVAGTDGTVIGNVVDLYLEVQSLAASRLYDGSGHRAHFTLRSLTRAISFAAEIAPIYSLRRALCEGFGLTFGTSLDAESQAVLDEAMFRHLLPGIRDPKGYVTQIPKKPTGEGTVDYELFQTFWVERGHHASMSGSQEHYIITPSVNAKLKNLARAVLNRKFPVLIQGPTSSGKTSMIEYLARRTGHKFVRINNHEHTDIQEYLGGYVSDNEGTLSFREGLLVEAVRNGYWIVLDELNLAPTDVLEALNRLLDDNQELLLPETQEVVRPHPHFMLFATQNPSGVYGGRKALSRAFRNRFLEMHFDDIPQAELEQILEQRCKLAPSYCKKLVSVYRELQDRRQNSRIFEGKDGFITLRDLFKWALRDAVGYQQLAENGYMILAERVRTADEKQVVKQVLEQECRVRIDEVSLYDLGAQSLGIESNGLVKTQAMKRLISLVSRCLQNREPVLLVGETGCGKTTVCELLASAQRRQLHIVNCQQHTETADFLGSQRPIRDKAQTAERFRAGFVGLLGTLPDRAGIPEAVFSECQQRADHAMKVFGESKEALRKLVEAQHPEAGPMLREINELYAKCRALFEWHDGPLVQAMKDGDFFLIDEISLAEDSVLERLNSVLETGRSLVLAEKGGGESEGIVAHEGFRILATMNPGGDFGKKELSPALRNRFTEIWVPPVTDRADLLAIVEARFAAYPELGGQAERMLDFLEWFGAELGRRSASDKPVYSLRDILSWADFTIRLRDRLGAEAALSHGLCMVFLDGLQINPSLGMAGISSEAARRFRSECLSRLAATSSNTQTLLMVDATTTDALSVRNADIGIEPFYIQLGRNPLGALDYNIDVPTTRTNLVRLLRALQLSKPILLEGSPGVGKTTLITQLARLSGHNIVRINLSEQTDLMDLFGSDLPVEGGAPGQFAWRSGPFLQAMEDGHWVLLDELNLASQAVLEGLNSCLDHRSSVYIAELDKTFRCAPGFKVFAAQNPHNQGGGRKGLPRSFVNRFVAVYVDQLELADLRFICTSLYPDIPADYVSRMVDFNVAINDEIVVKKLFGHRGQPWDFNLRDVFRWLDLVRASAPRYEVRSAARAIYERRMRTQQDREHVTRLLDTHFPFDNVYEDPPAQRLIVKKDAIRVGSTSLPRRRRYKALGDSLASSLRPLGGLLPTMEVMMKGIERGWMVLLVGASGSGKTSLVRLLAALTGNHLAEFGLNSSVDTMELVGGFEQADIQRHLRRVGAAVGEALDRAIDRGLLRKYPTAWLREIQILRSSLTTDTKSEKPDPDYPGMVGHGNLPTLAGRLRDVLDRLIDLEKSHETEPGLLHAFREARSELEDLGRFQAGSAGSFEWTDGTLVQAIEKGHWLLLDNANLCSPSVLDRLNSLLEPGGRLLINECGTVDGKVRSAVPHPDFRLFMAVDPVAGEISRAMRNRGLEVAILGDEVTGNQWDVWRLVNSVGLEGPPVRTCIAPATGSDLSAGGGAAMRSSTDLARNFLEICQRGRPLPSTEAYPTSRVLNASFANEVDRIGLGWPFAPGAELIMQDSELALAMNMAGAFGWLGALNSIVNDAVSPDGGRLRSIWAAMCVAAQSCHVPAIRGRLLSLLAFWDRLLPDFLASDFGRLALFLLTSDVPSATSSRPVILRHMRILKGVFDRQRQEVDVERRGTSRSLYQQSVLLQSAKIIAADISHPAVAVISRLFSSLSRYFLTEDSDDELLESHDRLWVAACRSVLRVDEMTVIATLFQRRLRTTKSSNPALQDLLVELDAFVAALGTEHYPALRHFWERFRARGLRTEVASTIEREIFDIISRIELDCQGSLQDWGNSIGATAAVDVKQALVEALASLYSLDRTVLVSEGDVAWIRQGIKVLNERLNVVQEVSGKTGGLTKASVWPLADLLQLRSRGLILAKLWLLEELPDDDRAALADEIRNYVSNSLGPCSYPLADSAYLMEAAWLSTDSASARDLAMLQPRLALGWQRISWSGSFTAHLMTARPESGSALETDVPLVLVKGPNALYGSTITHFVCSFAALASNTSIDRLESLRDIVDESRKAISENFQPIKRSYLAECAMLWQSALEALELVMPDQDNNDDCGLANNLRVALLAYRPILVERLAGRSETRIPAAMNVSEELIAASNSAVIRAVFLAVGEALTALNRLDLGEASTRLERGSAWTSLAVASLRLLVPRTPVDPAAQTAVRCELLEQRLRNLESLLELNALDDILGTSTSSGISASQAEVARLRAQLDELRRTLPRRPNQIVLGEMFRDLASFSADFLGFADDSSSRILSLRNHLLTGGRDRNMALDEEVVMQDMLQSAVQRLSTRYQDCRDMIDPICSRIFWVKHGLSLIRSGSEQARCADVFPLANNSLRYPFKLSQTVSDRMRLEDHLSTHEVEQWASHDIMEASLVRLATCTTILGDKAFAVAQKMFNTIARREVEAQKKALEERAEPTSIYRYKDAGRDSAEENELLERFPDYSADVQTSQEVWELDTTENSNADAPRSLAARAGRDRLSTPKAGQRSDCWRIMTLHRTIVDTVTGILHPVSNVSHPLKAGISQEDAFVNGAQAFAVWYQANISAASSTCELDETCFVGMLRLLHGLSKEFSGGEGAKSAIAKALGEPANFYTDPDVREAAHALQPLSSLSDRISRLLESWPEHEVLLEISRVCDRVSSFPASSPIMKWLTGFELLLRKCDDWESYASRDVTLKPEIEALTATIVRWRKMELESWKELLLWEEHKSEQATSKLWPHLFTSIANWDIGDNDEAAVPSLEELRNLVGTLDQFILSASAGEVACRLKMLDTFGKHLRLAADLGFKANLASTIGVLDNVTGYYGGLVRYATKYVGDQKRSIDKELRDYTRIASWKDVSVYALRESAARTHHHLFKFVKRYREVLDTPIAVLLQQYVQSRELGDPSVVHTKPLAVAVNAMSDERRGINDDDIARLLAFQPSLADSRLADAKRLIVRMGSVGREVASALKTGLGSQGFDELAVDIIETTATFAKEADSAGDVDGPHRSNMKAVRRKALVDLLRRLQKLGLSPRSLPASSGLDLVTTLTSLRPINFQSDPWSSADRYFFAVLSGVSKMRDLMGRRSHDLSDSEAARCLNYIENLLAMLRQQRSHLALTDALLHKLRALGRGLFKSPDIGGMDVWVSPSSLMLMHDAMSLVRDIEGFCDQFRELAKSHPDRFSQLAGIFELDCPTVLTELATVLAPLDSDTKAGILVTDRGLRAADQAADLAVNFIEKCHAAAGSDAINAAVYLDAAKEIETDLKRVRAGTAGIGPVPGDVSETSGAVGLLAHEAFRAIDEMLVGYQGALASATDLGASMKSGSEGLEGPDLDEYGLRPRQVAITDSVFANWHTKCKLDRVGQACETLKGALCALGDVEPTSTTAKEIGAIIKCTAGLFAAYFDDADRFAHELLVAHKTLAKLAHVLCQTFSGLFERGFCVPEPEKETKAEDEEKGQGGAGLGEGTGESNVSNQVEHEDELEGARDESGRQKGSESGPQEQRGNDGDDTVSMGEEFEGQLADVPQDQGEEGDDGEQNEADEQMGRVDGQGRQEVDNELWNKEDAKEEETGEAESGDLDENEETDDHGQEPPANLKNAREEAQKEDSKPSEDTADSADAGQQDNPQEAKYESELVAKQGEGEERDEVPDAREDAERERESRNEVNAQADENKSDGEGSEDQESGDRNDDVDIAEERTSEAGDAELQDAPHLVPDEGMNDEQEGSAELPDAMDLEGGDSDRDDLQEEADGVDAEMDDAVQQDHGEEAAAQDRAADVEMEAAEAQDDEGQGQAPEAGGQEGQDRHTKETVAQDRAGSTSQPGGDVRDRQSERAQEGPQPRRKMDLPDPSRSLGDAKKAWQRRLNMIDEGQKDNSAPDEAAGEDVQDADMFEHVPEGTESASKTQNLGAVQDEDSNVKVDGTEEQSADRTALEEEGRRDVAEMEPQLDALGEESVIQAENEPQSSSGGYRGGEIRDARADNVEMRAGTTGASTAAEGAVDESQQPLEPDGEDPIKTYEQLREEMDKLARGEEEADWHARETARKLWSQYENRTRHLSAALGEQLRLILEPTLAAQLKGDYKSGKRLNMRKIIPYIASSFKKDKIWLRRTRPSKRQYQIMIAVDDSKSMSESRSVQLTYESVAIMAKALSSIEAGELGVVRFGEDVKLLHDFESPFGSESGASVISQFTFNQTRTDVKLLLQHALGMFSAARDSAASRGQSGALDLWQLLVVMSDGIYEEHATVRSLIQQAAEQRIFVLFVVIDNRLERDSVLSMTNVNYVYVDGKPNLSFTRYMDTFPAEFYVVLRNIEALPSVLSSALKQFFSASTGV